MEKSPRYQPGRSFLELQLAFMNQAFSIAAQQMLRGFTPPAAKPRVRPAAEPSPTGMGTREQLAQARADYVTRMQEDVDQILHAFAMVPVAAERAILQSVKRPQPARGAGARRAAPVHRPARGAKARGEHAQ